MRRRVAFALALGLGVLVVGTVGYVLIERWSVGEALYMTIITVWTVGFGELHPLSSAGRLFTGLLILGGVTALAFAAGTLLEFIIEGHLRGFLEERRMAKRIEELSDHHVLVGVGRVGSVVAGALAEAGAPFVVIDLADEAIAHAREEDWTYVQGDATEEAVLTEAGIGRAKSLVTCLDTDAENTFVTLTAKSLNPSVMVVARSAHVTSEPKIMKAGASRVITPSVIGGLRMASMVLHPVVADYLDVISHGGGLEFRLEEVEVASGSPFDGHTIGELRIRHETGAFILAIRGTDGGLNTNPWTDTVLRAGDHMVAFGTSKQLETLIGMM